MNDARITEALERTKENIAVTDLEQIAVDRLAQAEKNVGTLRNILIQIDGHLAEFKKLTRKVRRIPENRKWKANIDQVRLQYLGKLEMSNHILGSLYRFRAQEASQSTDSAVPSEA